MALLSVIRRWHFRDGMPIREIERRTGLSRNTIRKYLRAGTMEPKFKVPERPSKLDPFAEKLSAGCGSRRASRASSGARSSRCMPSLSPWALTVPTAGLPPLRAVEGRSATRAADQRARHLRAAGLCAGRSLPVRLERGVGDHRRRAHQAAGGAYQAVAQPGVHRAGLSCSRPTRCCSMP